MSAYFIIDDLLGKLCLGVVSFIIQREDRPRVVGIGRAKPSSGP